MGQIRANLNELRKAQAKAIRNKALDMEDGNEGNFFFLFF